MDIDQASGFDEEQPCNACRRLSQLDRPASFVAARNGHVDFDSAVRFAVDNDRRVDEIICVVQQGDEFHVCYAGLSTKSRLSLHSFKK